jgi:hypothetical protein
MPSSSSSSELILPFQTISSRLLDPADALRPMGFILIHAACNAFNGIFPLLHVNAKPCRVAGPLAAERVAGREPTPESLRR